MASWRTCQLVDSADPSFEVVSKGSRSIMLMLTYSSFGSTSYMPDTSAETQRKKLVV